MNSKLAYLFRVMGWVSALITLVVLLGFSARKQKQTPIQDVEITIDRSEGNYFILEEDVRATLKNLGYTIPADSQSTRVDVFQIEQFLADNPYVEKADVYATINGKLKVKVEQRKPILRIFNNQNESFYLDESGKIMPLSFNYSARVMVANGAIEVDYMTLYRLSKNEKWNIEKFRESLLKLEKKLENLSPEESDSLALLQEYMGLYDLASFISSDEFWEAQISQIYVDNSGDLVLIPRVGNHEIIFGEPTSINTKFEKLKIFYDEALSKTGWNEYEALNLKFKNQVVCTKK